MLFISFQLLPYVYMYIYQVFVYLLRQLSTMTPYVILARHLMKAKGACTNTHTHTHTLTHTHTHTHTHTPAFCRSWIRLRSWNFSHAQTLPLPVVSFSGVHRDFFRGAGFQQIQLRTEDRDDGDLGAVAP